MIPSLKCVDLIKQFEGVRLQSYEDVKGVWTIGYGTAIRPDGTTVQKGDCCTPRNAEDWLHMNLVNFAKGIEYHVKQPLKQTQLDALTSFVYNIGLNGFISSTILKMINKDPNDAAIRDQFMVWSKAKINGVLQEVTGLKNRRKKEADYYFS